ncbi:hypothetical protein [Stutzerimonas azotifigens]|uniref:hypothetical protein n=1 Tax=Stutzerimonas azotifigens TaxID=291995 RepID=UPI00040FA8A8|nr:hypothetical protein [Stutzerimonas azotifigens]
MHEAFCTLALLGTFFLGAHLHLGRRDTQDLDRAAMLPFADDPEVARRMEREIRRSRTGCSCPGACDGSCRHHQRMDM